jgi:hypothetical protein
MPNISNPALGREFEQIALTNAINAIEIQYNLISSMGLFKNERVNTTHVGVEIRNIETELVLARPRDMKDQFLTSGKESNRKLIYVDVPHLPVDDSIYVADFQNIREMGTNQLTTIRDITKRRLTEAKQNIQATLEYFQMGALQGYIFNADGELLLDLFNLFDKSQTTINFEFTALTETQTKCLQCVRAIDIALGGDSLSGYKAFASDTFFDALTTADSTKEAYAGWIAAGQRLGGDNRPSFKFAGIEWINYNPIVKGPDGTNKKFIKEGDGIVFPVGSKAFQNIIAPAHTIKTANTMGVDFYARAWESIDGQTVHLRSEANQLPLCVKPDALIKVTT